MGEKSAEKTSTRLFTCAGVQLPTPELQAAKSLPPNQPAINWQIMEVPNKSYITGFLLWNSKPAQNIHNLTYLPRQINFGITPQRF